MKKIFKILTAAALTAAITIAAAGFAACGGKDTGDPYTITVGASITPHAEILKDVVKPELEKYGYTLKVVEFTDYVQPNTALEQGDLDANYFQHNLYLNDFNQTRGTHLTAVAQVHYEPFAVYRGSYTTGGLADIPNGSQVGVPNDGTNEARALLLLQKEGLITLRDGVTASNITKLDVVSNPKNLNIVELEAAQLTEHLSSLAIAVINGNYAIEGGLDLADALATEEATDDAVQQYINVIAVKTGNENKPKIKALKTAILSDGVREYIAEHYDGAVVAAF